MSRKRRAPANRPVPVSTAVPGQLELFAAGPTAIRPAGCVNPVTCTDYDPCRVCLAEARAAGLVPAGEADPSNTDPEGIDR